MSDDEGDSRFNELFSGLSRRHDGGEAKKLYEKNHSMIDRSKPPSNYNDINQTSARNYATMAGDFGEDSDDMDEDEDPLVFQEKLQKSKTIKSPKNKDASSSFRFPNEEKFTMNAADKRMSLFQSFNEASKETNDQIKDVLEDISSSSDDEDQPKDKGLRSKTELDMIYKLEQKEKRMSETIRKMKLIDIVQKNERTENSSTVIIDNTFALFGENSELEIPKEEKKLLEYLPLDSISKRIYDSSNEDSDGNPV